MQQLTHTSHASLGYGFKTSELDEAGDDTSTEDSEVIFIYQNIIYSNSGAQRS